MVDVEEMVRKAEEALEAFGGLYSFGDIREAIDKGEMQSFTDGESWVVTKIDSYPQKRVLNLVLGVGTIEGMLGLQPAIVEFAKEWNCDLMWSVSRNGWENIMTPGWVKSASIYVREIQ